MSNSSNRCPSIVSYLSARTHACTCACPCADKHTHARTSIRPPTHTHAHMSSLNRDFSVPYAAIRRYIYSYMLPHTLICIHICIQIDQYAYFRVACSIFYRFSIVASTSALSIGAPPFPFECDIFVSPSESDIAPAYVHVRARACV